MNIAPFQVRRERVLHPPNWCVCKDQRCDAPRRRRGSRVRPLSEDSKEPRNREPPWSRGQTCHQYPHEDGRNPSSGARCHITRRHITTHLYTQILHSCLSLTERNTKRHRVSIFLWHRSDVSTLAQPGLYWIKYWLDTYIGCLWSRHHDLADYVAGLAYEGVRHSPRISEAIVWGPHT